MEIIYNRIFLDHDTGSHPENKRRLECLGKLKETILENGEKYLELIDLLRKSDSALTINS